VDLVAIFIRPLWKVLIDWLTYNQYQHSLESKITNWHQRQIWKISIARLPLAPAPAMCEHDCLNSVIASILSCAGSGRNQAWSTATAQTRCINSLDFLIIFASSLYCKNRYENWPAKLRSPALLYHFWHEAVINSFCQIYQRLVHGCTPIAQKIIPFPAVPGDKDGKNKMSKKSYNRFNLVTVSHLHLLLESVLTWMNSTQKSSNNSATNCTGFHGVQTLRT